MTRKPAARGKKPEPPRRKVMPVRPPAVEKAVEEFTQAIRLFQKRDLGRARDAFKAILDAYPLEKEMGDRARTYLQICDRQLSPAGPRLKDADDYYHQGIVHLNEHDFDDALRMFEKALASDPASEKARYAQAATHALSGRRDDCIESLVKAIEASHVNRVRAANDPDFDGVRDDPEFRRLVHGDGGEAA